MNTVQENIETMAAAKSAVTSHCLCARLDEDARTVYLPEGYAVDAVRVSAPVSKTEMFNLMSDKLEQIWQESMWWK